MAASVHPTEEKLPPKLKYRWFPSWRMLTATLLCLCFSRMLLYFLNVKNLTYETTKFDTKTAENCTSRKAKSNCSVHMMNSNMGMAIVCMIKPSQFNHSKSANYIFDNQSTLLQMEGSQNLIDEKEMNSENAGKTFGAAERMDWSADEQGYIFSAFNLGLLTMLGTGLLADKFNAKYMIIGSVLIASFANLLIAVASALSVYYTIAGRFLVGVSDALLQPSVNSLITRWFPPTERSYALGLATGGRQLGTLLIVPASGALCSQTILFGGWPSIFYLSASIGIAFVIIYTALGADKPSKQTCIAEKELKFITASNLNENIGKKRMQRKVPWLQILKSAPVWSAVIAVICHEFPLMTMIMFLPSYLHDVHHYTTTENGILSALPTACLWISKILSSYLNTFLQRRTKLSRTIICKILNSIGSLGLGLFLWASTLLDSSHAPLAVILLCASMACAGLHTPGCQASLVSLAPAFSGAITGLTFFFVASAGIINPIITKWIVQKGTHLEWNAVFYMSTLVALIPVVTFNIWGSADVQWWARSSKDHTSSSTVIVTTESPRVRHTTCDFNVINFQQHQKPSVKCSENV
ncbi:unnamed protein product [Anisakis simplex]|uniref:Sialin (inferred by orthology to a human protein) n=1 Tax=Anisakis simplex TaxID=6269 RepID=A0A0M3JRF4_ANISI|nr:unnamed protein product [Anisakis simplex]